MPIRSRNSSRVSHFRRRTTSSSIIAMWAAGPPNAVAPSRGNTSASSRNVVRSVTRSSWCRERRKIAHPERHLDPGNFSHRVLESTFTEALVLLILEFLSELVVRGASNDRSKCGKQHRVLSRSMRAVHADKAAKCSGEVGRCWGTRESHDLVRQIAPMLMLAAQSGYERHFTLR